MSVALVKKPKRIKKRPGETWVVYEARGAVLKAMLCKDRKILLAGPAGTGKTRGALEKVNLCASKYAGMRGLMLRKTQTSLTASALVTFKTKVLQPIDRVHFFGGSGQDPAAFRYPNGSEIVVGGLDKSDKVLSTDYDIIYVNEAHEVSEGESEILSTRLRNGKMPYQQLIMDVNPQQPTHWLKQVSDAGKIRRFDSTYEDNPRYWSCKCRPRLSRCAADDSGCTWTDEGRVYIAVLDSLTGVRYKRLRLGQWAAADGLVYDGWDPAVHLIDRFEIPAHWPRYRSIDFGFVHPFVCQWWAEDSDGRLYRYRELYHTQRTVHQHSQQINASSAGEYYVASFADHDAEDRATLASAGIQTTAAYKAVSRGIQAVQERLKLQRDGKPRIFFLRDSLIEVDRSLVEAKRPFCTEQEFDSYVWHKDKTTGAPDREEPLKIDDDGMDAVRYQCAHHLLEPLRRTRAARSYAGV